MKLLNIETYLKVRQKWERFSGPIPLTMTIKILEVHVRQHLFYLLNYVTRRSENLGLIKKKNSSETK